MLSLASLTSSLLDSGKKSKKLLKLFRSFVLFGSFGFLRTSSSSCKTLEAIKNKFHEAREKLRQEQANGSDSVKENLELKQKRSEFLDYLNRISSEIVKLLNIPKNEKPETDSDLEKNQLYDLESKLKSIYLKLEVASVRS